MRLLERCVNESVLHRHWSVLVAIGIGDDVPCSL